MLAVPDAPAAADWYKRALEATELWNQRATAGSVPARPGETGTTTVRVEVFVDNPDAFVEHAIVEGAIGALDDMRDHDMPWGTHRQGGFHDPFGICGSSATSLRCVDFRPDPRHQIRCR